jgi:hypothetical protein
MSDAHACARGQSSGTVRPCCEQTLLSCILQTARPGEADARTAHDQLIRPGTRSIADSGAVRHDLRSKINRATTSSAHAINHIKSSRSA